MLPIQYLIAWLVLPLLLWAMMFCVRRQIGRVLIWIVCLGSIAAGTLLLANYVWALDAHLLAEVDKYDPDTPEAKRALEEWSSDTGRSALLLLSPFVTAVCYGVLFSSLFGLQRIVSHRSAAENDSENSIAERDTLD